MHPIVSSGLHIMLSSKLQAYGLRSVIAHVMPDGAEHPNTYASCTLSWSEGNYAQLEKETFALTFGINKFHQYLFGSKFTLLTDHKPLMTICGCKKVIPSLAAVQRALLLAAYDC